MFDTNGHNSFRMSGEVDDKTSLAYGIIVCVVGALAAVANLAFLMCIMNVVVASMRQVVMFFFCYIMLEMASSVVVVAMQPR